jgi:hypothetical protein
LAVELTINGSIMDCGVVDVVTVDGMILWLQAEGAASALMRRSI